MPIISSWLLISVHMSGTFMSVLPPVTRFAPSPTGYLHIGGARTALFNWLYSKRFGGKMLLRIEDTDRERSSEAAIAAILDGLTWLGLNWDGDVVSQFERAPRHREIAEHLVEAGKAYRCYATPAELDQMREDLKAAGKPPRYDGRWRDRPQSDAPEGLPYAIRIKAPASGETVIDDGVQGTVKFPNADLDDFIILRSDGNPTYMLAVVVDDHDMGVTQIIRGDDHLTNAARQQIIYDAMGWPAPKLAHIPLIHGADGAKLSKRHGALGIDAYREMGYLPQALRNYLSRLGWSHGDDEIMSLEQMIEWFDIKDVNRGASRLDFAKLEALNGHYIRASDDAELTALLLATARFLPSGSILATAHEGAGHAMLLKAMPGLKQRAKTLEELAANCAYLFAARPLLMDEKARELVASADAGVMEQAFAKLSTLGLWTPESLETAIRELSEAMGLKLGKVAQPLRAALTGRATSPGLFDVMDVLGRDESLNRLKDQIST
jgi:glutamyl-tRNA synthetase